MTAVPGGTIYHDTDEKQPRPGTPTPAERQGLQASRGQTSGALTSLYARAYLLKRRLQQGKIEHEYLDDLAMIMQDAQVIETRMQELEEMGERLEPVQEED